jgi:hypothetical protein
VLLEAVTGLAILLTVALLSAGGGAGPASIPSSQLSSWSRVAVPAVIALVDDLRTIDNDTAQATNPFSGSLRSDASALDAHIEAPSGCRYRPMPRYEPRGLAL